MRFSSDKVIPEDVKQAANQEMVTTAKLGDEIGTDQACSLSYKNQRKNGRKQT